MFESAKKSILHWRVIHLMGVSALRARYARSYFGQIWLTVTGFVQVLIIGVVWAFIWRQPIDAFLPYYGVGQIILSFITQNIGEGSTCFVTDSNYYMNDKMPFLVSIFANFYRNFLVLLHNIPIVVALLIWSQTAHVDIGFSFIPAALMTVVFVVLCSYMTAMLCARFRDLIQLVNIVLGNIFLLTPVMWTMDVIPERFRLYALLNPFASILEILRNPLIGTPINPNAYVILAGWTVIFLLACMVIHRRLSNKLIFWI